MQHLLPLFENFNVTPLRLALRRNSGLWNAVKTRTASPTSPHREVDDIWVRYAETPEAGSANTPHDSVWLQPALALPEAAPLAFQLMAAVSGERLGGILITRIPPGRRVYPHTDRGWHAQYYDKFAIQISSHPQQSFNFSDGAFHAKPGDVYWFDNSHSHWVENPSPVERITMIVCIKPHSPLNNPLKSPEKES